MNTFDRALEDFAGDDCRIGENSLTLQKYEVRI